jgi:hypothetical protein
MYLVRISVEGSSTLTGFVVLSLQINARTIIQATIRGVIIRVANGAAVPSNRVQEAESGRIDKYFKLQYLFFINN